MEDKVNYSLVGAFVLALGAALIGGVLWLAADVGARDSLEPYQAFIQESVAGLNKDAPVKYLGVDVGKVTLIEIDPQNPQQVRLRFLIKPDTPIKQDTVAVLKTQGLTGIAYVELSGGSAGSKPLRPGDGDVPSTVPTIPFSPSLAARLENVLTSVLNNVGRMSDNLNAVFDADNRAALKSTLADTAALAQALAAQKDALSAGVADAARTARSMAHASAQLSEQLAPTLDRITASADAVERMAEAANAASVRAGLTADAAASGVQQLRSDTLPEVQRLLAELNQLSASLRQLSDQTSGSPNRFLVGAPSRPLGPGESVPP